MSKKRFTDAEVWEKDWFYELTPVEKLAWFYIKDKCSNIGIWTPSKTVAPFFLGSDIDWEAFAEKCNGNIKVLESGKWWLVDFCKFQHPDLKPESEGNANKAVQSYIRELREHGLWDLFIARATGVGRASNAPKEQERVKEQVEAKKEPRKKYGSIVLLTPTDYDTLCATYGLDAVGDKIRAMNLYCEANGKTYKSYAAAVRSWFKRDGVDAGDVAHLQAYLDKGYSLAEAKQLYSEGTKP